MKRSEALKLIQNILETERSRLIGSEKILSALEEAGMLPPINEEKSFIMLPDGEMIYNVNEWDEE